MDSFVKAYFADYFIDNGTDKRYFQKLVYFAATYYSITNIVCLHIFDFNDNLMVDFEHFKNLITNNEKILDRDEFITYIL